VTSSLDLFEAAIRVNQRIR